MLKTCIIGASGYTGAELALMVSKHAKLSLSNLYVSANSLDARKKVAELHGKLEGQIDMPLLPLDDAHRVAKMTDVVFLATAHKVSHDLAPIFLNQGCQVYDLSAAFRVNHMDFYSTFYGFEHQHQNWLESAVYGLAEWQQQAIKTTPLIALAGCYPTASLLAIKPLIVNQLIDTDQWPVINAVSGVSGAGRKASMTNSFCEVSHQAYGIFTHRHQPEIAKHLGAEVIFTPHLGNFKRGILATITMKLAKGVGKAQISEAYTNAYQNKPAIRLKGDDIPCIGHVENTPFCDIGWQVQGEHLIVVSAIDNLLKGASSQAMQCLNIHYGFDEFSGIL